MTTPTVAPSTTPERCSRASAAAMLAVSSRTLDQLVAAGAIAAQRVGSAVRVDVASVLAFAAALPPVADPSTTDDGYARVFADAAAKLRQAGCDADAATLDAEVARLAAQAAELESLGGLVRTGCW